MKSPRPVVVQATLMTVLALFVLWPEAGAGADVIPFESDRWVMVNAESVEHMGRTCLMGTAYLEGVEFENGVIEVDIALDGRRTYAGVNFRVQGPRDYEQFYIRPHRASLYPDALQYSPVFSGISCWQLYNGEGFTAGADIPVNTWIHLRLEVMGTQARIYLGDDEQPALVIQQLVHGLTKGTLGLYGRTDGASYFSNFGYTIDNSLEFDPPRPPYSPPGLITGWEISQPFQASHIELDVHPDVQQLPEIEWRAVTAEASGMVNVARFTGRTGREPDCVVARTTITSDRARTREYLFGYSDYVSIFLNGDIMFSGNSAYQKRDPSFLGIVGLNDALYLPLREGDNELLFVVAESFGGWGFICQDAEAIYEHPDMTRSWETPGDFRTPEAVVYDAATGVIYVSNYDAYNPSYGQGRQSISRISLTGEVKDLDWVTGLNNPTGMALSNGKLFVVERTGVVEIDTRTSQILGRHPIAEPGFLNDIAVDGSGNIYVSDSRRDVIYRGTGGEFEDWLAGPEIDDPNGLHVAGDKLLVGNNGDASVKCVEVATGEVATVVRLSSGVIDGVTTDEAGNYLVSHWEGRIHRITPSREVETLLDTSVPGIYCADFEYIRDKGLFIIPTFFENTVLTYHIEK